VAAHSAYQGRRRSGVKGRLGLFRGVVLDVSGNAVASTRSPRLAHVIARALNGENLPRRKVDDASPLSRYTVGRTQSPSGAYAIYAAESTARSPSEFGDGVVAFSADRALAETVANTLNHIDPQPRPRIMRGMGWW
jgi:hypothetical protein